MKKQVGFELLAQVARLKLNFLAVKLLLFTSLTSSDRNSGSVFRLEMG
jgi:hypothetical protein